MLVQLTKTEQLTTIHLQGRFDYGARLDFDRAVQESLGLQAPQIQLDMKAVEYMDSAALGMLLLLRDKATGLGKTVCLAETQGFVKKILEVANFHKLFQML